MFYTENGKLYTFGSNDWGQLGHGNTVQVPSPKLVKRESSSCVYKPLSDAFMLFRLLGFTHVFQHACFWNLKNRLQQLFNSPCGNYNNINSENNHVSLGLAQ